MEKTAKKITKKGFYSPVFFRISPLLRDFLRKKRGAKTWNVFFGNLIKQQYGYFEENGRLRRLHRKRRLKN
jgi:hypothetical protein